MTKRHFSRVCLATGIVLGLTTVACTASPTEESKIAERPTDLNVPVLHGFLRSEQSETIRPPAGRDWSYKILHLTPEGTRVKPGDRVAQFEGEEVKKHLRDAENQILKSKVDIEAKISKLKDEIETLEQEISDGDKDLEVLKAGSIDESLATEWLMSARDKLIADLDIQAKALDLKLDRAKLKRKRHLLTLVTASTQRDINRLELKVSQLQEEIAASDILATSAGVVVYKLNWNREKPRQGGVAYRGTDVLDIVDDKNLFVEAYLKEVDWSVVHAGQKVEVNILGRREVKATGTLKQISNIVMPVSDWERSLPAGHSLFETRAFRVVIELDQIPGEAKPNGEVVIEPIGGGEHAKL